LLLFTITIGIAHYWDPILETVTAAAMEKKRHLPLMSRQHDDKKLYLLSSIYLSAKVLTFFLFHIVNDFLILLIVASSINMWMISKASVRSLRTTERFV
jgi:hypothetical protein